MKDNYVYPARIEKQNDDIILRFIDFDDVIAFGATESEAIEAAQEVLALTLIDLLDRGEEPPAISFEEQNVIYINVWLPYYRNMTKEIYIKKTVTIPQWLDLLAKERNINYSACMVRGIKEELGLL
ncbi:MAG: type II toxin-antitoxin system HicB family antitoxin [Lachnospiraceae bacterium]|nr:type II toxin-antitoxin system HicB family antitoxin [Lachnospiraceae bacterium]